MTFFFSPYFSQTDDDECSTIDLGPTNITIYHMKNEKKRLTTELASKQGAKETLGQHFLFSCFTGPPTLFCAKIK